MTYFLFFLLNVHAQAEFWLRPYAAECKYSFSHLNPARESKTSYNYSPYVIHEPLGLKVDCKLYHTDCTFNKLMVSVYLVKDKITLRPDYVVILH